MAGARPAIRVVCALAAAIGLSHRGPQGHAYQDTDPRPAAGAVSAEQAQCLLRNRRVAFLGDSNTRYHFFEFNVFVDTGMLRSGPFGKWGARGPPDFDRASYGETWTSWKDRSSKDTHRQNITKTFPDLGLSTHFYFVETTWFDSSVTSTTNMEDLAEELRGFDLIVFNSAWWDLKPWNEVNRGYVQCGDNWTETCATSYARDVDTVVERILKPAKAAVWREASCCGDTVSWRFNVAKMNAIAKAAMAKARLGFVPTFYMYGLEGLQNSTMEGKHARPEFRHRWTVGVLQAAERQLRTGCLGTFMNHLFDKTSNIRLPIEL